MDGPSQLGLVNDFYCFSIRWPNERRVRMRLPPRRKQWPSSRCKTSRGLPGVAYRPIGNAYRAPKSFVILQRTNAAFGAAVCETAAVCIDCSALHRVRLFHVGGFT
jgi:hypothetical protein